MLDFESGNEYAQFKFANIRNLCEVVYKMSSNELVQFLSVILRNLRNLIESAQKENALLEQELESKDCHQLLNRILNLISKIRTKYQLFEEDLMKKAEQENIHVDLEDNSIMNDSVVEDNFISDSKKDCRISLTCNGSIRTEIFSNIKNFEIEEFWSDLRNFILRYGDDERDQRDQTHLQKLPCGTVQLTSTDSQEDLVSKLKEIFGSDSEKEDNDLDGSEVTEVRQHDSLLNRTNENEEVIHKEKSCDQDSCDEPSNGDLQKIEEEEISASLEECLEHIVGEDFSLDDSNQDSVQEDNFNSIETISKTSETLVEENTEDTAKNKVSEPSKQCLEHNEKKSISSDCANENLVPEDKSSIDSDGVSSGVSIETIIKTIEDSREKHSVSVEGIIPDKTPQNEIEIEEIESDTLIGDEEREQINTLNISSETQNLENSEKEIEEAVKNSLEECIKQVIEGTFEICTVLEATEQKNISSKIDNSTVTISADKELPENKETDHPSIDEKYDEKSELDKLILEEKDDEIDVHYESFDETCSDKEIEEKLKEISIKADEDDNNPEKENFFNELGLHKRNNYDKSNSVRDELMKIFAEVDCEEDETGTILTFSGEDDNEEEKYTNDDVKEALDYLAQSESDSDVESVESLNTDDLFESSDEMVDESERITLKKCIVKVKRENLRNLQQKISEENQSQNCDRAQEKPNFKLKDCFVKLEVLKLPNISSESEITDESESSSEDEDSEIDRLCDLSTLDRKRKKSSDLSEDGNDKKKHHKENLKRRRKKRQTSSETPDLSGYSTVSEEEFDKWRGGIFDDVFKPPETSLPIDPTELLTEIVCHTVHDSDSDSSSVFDSEDSAEETKKKKKSSSSSSTKNEQKEKSVRDKDSWRNDPLLTGRLDVREYDPDKKGTKRKIDVNSEFNDSTSQRTRKNSKKYKRLDPNWRSDEESSDSSFSSGNDFEKDKTVKKLKFGLDEETSDIEIVDITADSPIKTGLKTEDENNDKKSTAGRKNIKSVLSIEDLTKETQKAAEEELERIIRLDKRNQMRMNSEEDQNCVILDTSSDGYKITVDPSLSKRMYEHQVAGVKFMWDACYESVDTLKSFEGTGCILAHSMGLGKTFQVVSLVHTLFCHSITRTKHVLVVCPLSTVSGWSKEFNNAIKLAAKKPAMNIVTVESRSYGFVGKYARVQKWQNRGGVLIIGYEAFMHLTMKNKGTHEHTALRKALMNPGPELVVLDEGHLLKNGKAQRTKALMEIRTKRRIILTGTPLQNNLTEYYYMVQFVKPNLLGTPYEFQRQFANPIMNGQYEDSDLVDIQIMKKRTHVLHRLLKNTVQRYEASELKKYIKNIEDYALFIQLHPVQELLYKQYISLASSRIDPKSKKKFRAFFSDYQLTKYICSHPQLLDTMEAQNKQGKKKKIKETDVISDEPEVQEIDGIPCDWWKQWCSEEVRTNLEFGTKLQVMMGLIEEAEKNEEKVLIFTSSLVELSSIEYFLKLKGTSSCPSWMPRRDYFRMDGTVPPDIRTRMCELFNDKQNKKLRLFIMSHKVGGLGLNLVAANRVILLGANFNPSHDTQSIFRAYRFGQEKTVHIYRLLSMGTMEEKIYNRCVTKLAVASRVVDKHQIARHYKNLDLEDLYTVNVDLTLKRTTPAMPTDEMLAKVLLRFECIHKYHHHQKLLENLPDEDLNEEDKIKAWEEFKSIGVNKPPVVPSISDITKQRWQQLNPTIPLMQKTVQGEQYTTVTIPSSSSSDPIYVKNFLTANKVSEVNSGNSELSSNSTLNDPKNHATSSNPHPSKIQYSIENTNRNGIRTSNYHKEINQGSSNVQGTSNHQQLLSNNKNKAGTSSKLPKLIANNPIPINQRLNEEGATQPSNPKNRKSEKVKVPSSLIGPNPLAAGNARNGKPMSLMFRKTSSDDFQKPSSNKKKPLMAPRNIGSNESTSGNNKTLKVQPEQKAAKGGVGTSTGGTNVNDSDEEDDDVIFVKEGQIRPERVMLREMRDTLVDRGITVTSNKKKKKLFVIKDKSNENIIDLS